MSRFFLSIKQIFSETDHKTIIILLLLISLISIVRRSIDGVQEDNYIGYALSFENKLSDLSYYDSRLYPGFPILIFLSNIIFRNLFISSYSIIFLALILGFIMLNKTVKQKDNLFIFLFPPIMLDVATKVTNEYLTVFLILLSVYFFFNNKYIYSAFFIGLNWWIRPVGILLFPAMLFSLFIYKKKIINIKLLIAFLFPIILFMLYNLYFFNTLSPFHQLFVYKFVSPYGNAIGFIQVFKDVFRAFEWGQFNIFLSGIFYIAIFIFIISKVLINLRTIKDQNNLFLATSIILMSLYVFTYTFNPFLENLARYITPIIVLSWVLFYNKFNIPNYAYALVLLSIIITLR